MKVRKTMLVATAASVIGLASVAGMVSAESGNTGLVDKISQRFNLNKNDVQKVFDEDRTAHEAGRESRYEARLMQAVKDGKLTEGQKTKLVAKHKELQAEMEKNHESMKAGREAFANKTDAERQTLMVQRRAEMDKKRAEIEAWEKQNNIPSGYLFGGFGGRGQGNGPGGPF
ncbi:MAG TPA: hypothetical protein VMR98_02340 [Candidatus Polarisedimenticolaceae bacterium]|nr:hypothetical protein [Candidatus Polarisedimenticolaceae bacterium]